MNTAQMGMIQAWKKQLDILSMEIIAKSTMFYKFPIISKNSRWKQLESCFRTNMELQKVTTEYQDYSHHQSHGLLENPDFSNETSIWFGEFPGFPSLPCGSQRGVSHQRW